jgi:hypothetical protein
MPTSSPPFGLGTERKRDSQGSAYQGVSEYLTSTSGVIHPGWGRGSRPSLRWGCLYPCPVWLSISGVIALDSTGDLDRTLLHTGSVCNCSSWGLDGLVRRNFGFIQFSRSCQPFAGTGLLITYVYRRRTFAAYILLSAFCLGWITLCDSGYLIGDSRLHTGDLQRRTAWPRNIRTACVISTEQPRLINTATGKPSSWEVSSQITQKIISHIPGYYIRSPRAE